VGYNPVYVGDNQATFRRNISPPSSESKSKPNKKAAGSYYSPIKGGTCKPIHQFLLAIPGRVNQ
jgi:hypothetical protein